MDPVTALALAAGLAWASGIRLYAAWFISGSLHALGIVTPPPSLRVLAQPIVLVVGGILLAFKYPLLLFGLLIVFATLAIWQRVMNKL